MWQYLWYRFSLLTKIPSDKFLTPQQTVLDSLLCHWTECQPQPSLTQMLEFKHSHYPPPSYFLYKVSHLMSLVSNFWTSLTRSSNLAFLLITIPMQKHHFPAIPTMLGTWDVLPSVHIHSCHPSIPPRATEGDSVSQEMEKDRIERPCLHSQSVLSSIQISPQSTQTSHRSLLSPQTHHGVPINWVTCMRATVPDQSICLTVPWAQQVYFQLRV